MILMPFQPFEDLPMILATGDVLLAILEPDAGVFAVPSKVLTYLCADRPLLLSVPFENLAARIVRDNNAGIVVPPSETKQFVDSAMTLLGDPGLRNSLAANGKAYAKRKFDIDKITDRFEAIIQR
jgi:glycosyltransferase involved in cell wall biosynthesis